MIFVPVDCFSVLYMVMWHVCLKRNVILMYIRETIYIISVYIKRIITVLYINICVMKAITLHPQYMICHSTQQVPYNNQLVFNILGTINSLLFTYIRICYSWLFILYTNVYIVYIFFLFNLRITDFINKIIWHALFRHLISYTFNQNTWFFFGFNVLFYYCQLIILVDQ